MIHHSTQPILIFSRVRVLHLETGLRRGLDYIALNAGQEVVWDSDKRNLGTCSNVVFNDSVGKEPEVQVKTDLSNDFFCPKSVQLKINDKYFCGKMIKDDFKNGYFQSEKEHNSIIHDTTRGRC